MNKQHENSLGNKKFESNFKIRIAGSGQMPQRIGSNKFAIVCEGGGQRGIFTAGILDSFLNQKYFPFHTLIGVSAGAQNLTSYACGARGYARHAILRYTTKKEFYNPLRFARGGHLIDLDWYFDALSQDVPLDTAQGIERLRGRSFQICASRRDTLQAEYLSFLPENLLQSIKASCAIPLFYRERVVFNGVDYCDGGVADSLPVQAAHHGGCDCIVVIRTQPRESIKPMKLLSKQLGLSGLKDMVVLVDSYMKNYNVAMDFIENPPGNVCIIDIAPIRPLKSRLLGSRVEWLRHDYQVGQLCGLHFLDQVAWRICLTKNRQEDGIEKEVDSADFL